LETFFPSCVGDVHAFTDDALQRSSTCGLDRLSDPMGVVGVHLGRLVGVDEVVGEAHHVWVRCCGCGLDEGVWVYLRGLKRTQYPDPGRHFVSVFDYFVVVHDVSRLASEGALRFGPLMV
jgi:hypothetical protein